VGLLTFATLLTTLGSLALQPQVVSSLLWAFPDSSEGGYSSISFGSTGGITHPPFFHVSQLKHKLGRSVEMITQLPPTNDHAVIQPELDEILDRHSE